MKFKLLILLLFLGWGVRAQNYAADSMRIKGIYDLALTKGEAYRWLDDLSNKVGGRLSGSPEAAMAVEWAQQVMDSLGLDSVWLQPVMVPHWVRGEEEKAAIFSEATFGREEVNVCALGGSVATSPEGLRAPVVEVRSFEELEQLGESGVRGKIVFFNTPMNAKLISTFHAYGSCVGYRVNSASRAADYGALAVIVRSMTLKIDDDPHTGVMHYRDSSKKIPAAAISTRDAERLSRALKHDPNLEFYLKMNCHVLPDVLSFNVIGEIRGSEFPDEIITVGGHLDSWDLGDGAHDDGAGCVQSMEVLRLFRESGYQPKRTIRAVLFMNEENGLRGGIKYAEEAKRLGEKHLAALESDAGGFSPRGFSVNDSVDVVEYLQSYLSLFEPYGVYMIRAGYGGADISRLKVGGTTLIGLLPDPQRYFDYHHSREDTFDKVNPRELHLGAASMASLVYLISEYGIPKKMKKN